MDALLGVALDLTRALEPAERHRRLLRTARQVIPYDSACLMRLEGSALVPVAAEGLREEVMGRRFERLEHPRLDILLRSQTTVRFRPDAPIPDPFDGLLASVEHSGHLIHACVGCRVSDVGEVVGVLAFDAVDTGAFAAVDDVVFSTFAALAGAALRTESLFNELRQRADRGEAVAQELHREVDESKGGMMIGSSEALRRVLDDIGLVARSELPVLVCGETGVGKELVARRLHARSDRAGRPLIHVNCAALPASIIESELFGHVRGAFTGAHADRPGKFDIADGGTLFLDEVGELPLELQGNLLRVLQDGEIQRVGSDIMHRVDVRVIAATNRDLEAEVRKGTFRADLYHRLAAFPIYVPALRERRDDIPLLASHFVARMRPRLGIGPVRMSEEALDLLRQEPWMGNIRELENVISRGVLRAAREPEHAELILVEPRHLDVGSAPRAASVEIAPEVLSTAPPDASFRERCDSCKRSQIEALQQKNHGNWAATARDMGMHRSNLHRLATRLKMIEKED